MKKTTTISDVFDTEHVKIVNLKVVNDRSVVLFDLTDRTDGYGLAFYTDTAEGNVLDAVYTSYDRRLMEALFTFSLATLEVVDAGVVLRENGMRLGAIFEPYSLSVAVDVLVENGETKKKTKQTSLRDFGEKPEPVKKKEFVTSNTERSIDRVVRVNGGVPQKYSITYETVTGGDVMIVFKIDGRTVESVRLPKKYADDGWKLLYRRIVEPETMELVEGEILDGFKKLKFIFSAK